MIKVKQAILLKLLICTWGLIFFAYMIILLYTIPDAKENIINILTLKNGFAEFAVISVFIILGILSLIHIIRHIIYLKKVKVPVISTLFKHLFIALTFMIVVPIYYFKKDPHGEIDKWDKKMERKIALREELYGTNQNQNLNNNNNEKVEYGFIRDDKGNLTTYSKSQLKDANGRVYSENVHFKDDEGNDHDIYISK